ncbi:MULTISPECIES: hypothetical protein [Bradyrhizobium]|uniref:hypothetical protein n=1 Tax=Bradyrhizobium TaxID=374 RepID=UPI001EDACA90|nr:hypothetical protein [Bradyrhizobium zhengyangense]MCG2641433.1 hypothetical protein [Bradyrhizobium zhengyangense]
MSRRGFLAGAASSALTIEAALAAAGNVVAKVLRIDLLDGGRAVAVREVPENPNSPDPGSQWCVQASAFGPKAWFELVVVGADASKRLRVRQASFGGSQFVRLEFYFEPKIVKDKDKQVVDHWNVSLITGLWNDAKKANTPWKSSEIAFADFVSKKNFLEAPPGLAQARTRFSEMFEGRVVASDKPAILPNLQFLPDCVWRITGSAGAVVSAFNGRARAHSFTFGWYGFGQGAPFFRGVAGTDKPVTLDQSFFRLGEAGGTNIEIADTSALGWEARRTDSPLMPGKGQTFAKLGFGACQISLSSDGGKTARDIPAASLFVTETSLPKAKAAPAGKPTVLRYALWGDVKPSAGSPGFEMRTLVGRLVVDAPPKREKTPDTADKSKQSIVPGQPAALACAPGPCPAPQSDQTKDCANPQDSTQNSDALAAVGDRAGASTASIWAVFDRAGEAGPFEARRIAVDLSLFASNLSLSDVSHSSIAFEAADLRLLYEDGKRLDELKSGELPRASASSYVWVGPTLEKTANVAQFDLSRATLTVARDRDLVKLRFRFLDLNLVLCPKPVIRPAHPDCRVIEVEKGVFRDDRPVLVAEFDPQHVFEEAIFRQNLPPPDIQLDDPDFSRDKIISKLASFDTSTEAGRKDLLQYRQDVRDRKINAYKVFDTSSPPKEDPTKEDPTKKAACEAFKVFSDEFSQQARRAGLPEPQQIYIGPFALDPDGMALTRPVAQKISTATITDAIKAMFDRIDAFIKEDAKRSPRLLAPVLPPAPVTGAPAPKVEPDEVYLANALRNETILEQQEPLYGVFRDFYRDARIGQLQPADGSPAQSFDQRLVEYLAASNRPAKDDPNRGKHEDEQRKGFIDNIVAAPSFDRLSEARLSGRSRLAFHVNCQPAPGATPEETGLNPTSGAAPSTPASGGFTYPELPFTFDALTDWSRHEPAVTLRARKLFTANPSGILPPIGERASNLTDADILAFQGLTLGSVTAEQRLGEIRASLARKPEKFETAIELPARLTLSTAQDAVWLADRLLPEDVRNELSCATPKPLVQPLADKDDNLVLKDGETSHSRKPLWTTRLSLDGAEPDLRIVDSPDFRPLALSRLTTQQLKPGEEPSPIRKPGQGAPPRGPLAPWFIGPEQMDAGTLTAGSLNESLKPAGTARPETPDLFCKPPLKDRIWRILRALCERDEARAQLSDWRLFRATLDAYDRHELVLLSSAYGLPVIGKRKPREGDPPDSEVAGGLVANSGQMEPGDLFPIMEADDGQAVQRPQPLRVTELWLSALGGSLTHDTLFYPSAGLDDLWGKKIFDGFSIERWRAEIVIGRDIVGEVVYKGYLFPLGHRASLVKLTERLFLLTKNNGVKAILVQRIFLRVGRKSQAYPAIGQAFQGRLWCAQDVTIRTLQTPDLRDPYELPKGDKPESPQGRIGLDGAPGLAFWPRINETDAGLVKFDLTLDGAVTSMPLIFVDNIAATNAASLKRLIERYRETGIWTARRTLALGLQKIRFAPEWKPGDCSLKTESIFVDVHARLAELNSDWAGNLGEYKTTPILEGAEQPPFYPAMRSASVRLEHVERFSGGKPNSVEVQYDGHYVRLGFSDRSAENPANPMEIFLDLRKCVSMSMGNNGDRSGAIGRPDSDIVAIGRRKGPMGASGTINYAASAPPANTPMPVSVSPDATLIKDEHPDKFETLVSLAAFFDATTTAAAVPAPANPSRQLVVGTRSPSPKDDVANTLKLLQGFFSGSAKILGVVTFRDLLSFLGLGKLFESTPLLRQTLEFGSGALDSLNDGAQSVVEDIHARILVPLKTVVDKLNEQWTALDAKLRPPKIGDKPSLGLTDVFPEIAAGLRDLSSKLALAAAENDAIQLALDLGDIYESGHAFADALDRIAANPLARLKQAAIGQVQQVLANFAQAITVFKDPLAVLKARLDEALDKAAIANFIDDQLSGHDDVKAELDQTLGLTLAPPDLVTLLQQTGQAMDADLTAIVDKFKKDLALDVATFAKKGVADILDGKPVNQVVANFVGNLKIQAETAVSAAKKSIKDKLEAANQQAVYIVTNELDAFLDSVTSDITQTPAFEQMLKAAQRAWEIIDKIQGAAKDIGDGKISDALAKLDMLAGLLFGVGSGPFAKINGSLTKEFSALQSEANNALIAIVNGPTGDAVFAKEVLACKTYADLVAKNDANAKLVPVDPASGEPMKTLLPAVKALDAAAVSVANVKTELADAGNVAKIKQAMTNAGMDPNSLTPIVNFADLTEKFLIGAGPPDYGLRGDVSTLYCQSVKTLVRLRAVLTLVASNGSWDNIDKDFSDRFAQYIRAVFDSAKTLGETLSATIRRIDNFVIEHDKVIAAGALLGGAAEYISTSVPNLDATVKNKFTTLKAGFDATEPDLVAKLTEGIKFAIKLLTSSASFASKLVATLETQLQAVGTGIAGFGIDLNPEFAGMKDAVKRIKTTADSVAQYQVPVVPKRFADLSAMSVTADNSVKLSGFLKDLNGKYFTLTRELFDAEAAAIAQWRALQARAKGLPWLIQGALFKKVQPRIGDLAKTYGDLAEARDAAATNIDSPLFSLQARRALFAQPVFKPTTPPFNVDDPNASLDALKKSDRLREEVGVLADAAAFAVPAVKPAATPEIDNLLRFFSSWTDSTAAPLQIADRVKALAQEVLRGEILSLIDVAAFRDAILDAVSQLVPARAVFSYDFSSTVTEEPNEGSIFQAQQGAQFVLSTRLTVDLLAPKKADFQASGTLGAFDVKLVGDFIDAVRLRFGGAKFEARGDSKPRFDVSYLDYEIGEDLQFAAELQSFLTPSNGSGVHIGPLARTLGLEAGYGINLGSIGVGEVSFFNVILDVSAELPFTQSEALFKTSLGTRLCPFTISILPFAGSGYFSIFAAADGIRGFEASFLFGGGGSLQFGPLAAQVQIQVGAFIRVLRVDGVSSTELYGTFLAAGSASIWIFHFAATLYVSLGQDAAGNVHGEATFTFSFSVGFIDYDYSVTASHNEPALGSKGGGDKKGGYLLPDSEGRVQFAELTDPSVMSEVSRNAFGQAASPPSPAAKGKGKSKSKAPAQPVAYASPAAEQIADVISKAKCQSDDWAVFSSYFDVTLLPTEL